tara:strand:- start:3795 stop:4382 length:588 start_codon:yes stop_codon:yes gene_type:complete
MDGARLVRAGIGVAGWDWSTQARTGYFYHQLFFSMTNYQFKSGHYVSGVGPQDAGEELERINNKYGKTTPADVVDESRPDDAVLHPAFEWDDEIAAEEHRKTQARQLIRAVRIVNPEKGEQPAYVHVNVVKAYLPSHQVAASPDLFHDARNAAIRRLHEAQRSLDELEQIAEGDRRGPVQEAIKHINKGTEALSS